VGETEMKNIEIIDENISTKHLNWFDISKSLDGEYFTQKEVAQAIFEVFEPNLKKEHLIFDPCAGNGRLLVPFKKAGSQVLGIEFKENLANSLKHNIGKDNCRIGDIRDYFKQMIKVISYYGAIDIAVCNPPYGLKWDIEDMHRLTSSNNGELVESQLAVLEMLKNVLKPNGMMVLIIPTSTWSNKKDIKLINMMFENFELYEIVTLQKGFKKEYNLNLLTDIVFMRKKIGYQDNCRYRQTYPEISKHVLSIDNISELKNIVRMDLHNPYYESISYLKSELAKIPKLDTLTPFQESNYKLDIGMKGVTGNECILSLLDFYDKTNLDHYNPVMGKPTSIKECYFSLPSLIKIGVEPVQQLCREIDIDINFTEENKKKFAKLKEKWDFESTPIYKPKAHELLAYYDLAKYPAKDTLIINGKVIYNKGSEYLIKPTWVRNNHITEETELTDDKGKKTGEVETKSLESGYLTLEVKSEIELRVYAANEEEKIQEFLSVFDLPDIKGIAELYPERVKNWANVIAKNHDHLFDYQAEDISRALCKRNLFIGWDMGVGKTIGAFAYAEARKYQRVLVIVEGALVQNWLNKGNEFGIKISAIRSHSDIWKLKWRIKNKDFPRHSTEFFVVGQEFLSLDGGKIYNEWTCQRRNKDGVLIHSETCTKGKCSEGHKYEVQHKTCPMCGAEYSEGWTGRYCNAVSDNGKRCGYRPYSYGLTANGRGMNQFPAYKHMKKLFSCVITDESQNYANRSLRGEATRTFKSKSKVMLTGTIMKNYVNDVFLNFGWLLGYQNPIYYYKRGDVKRFLDEFGSYELISKSYLNEMSRAKYRSRQGGRKKLLPAVSNLNRFWKMTSPFTIRRKSNIVSELKDIQRERIYHNLDMEGKHYNMYVDYEEWAKKIIDRELRKEDQEINLGVISGCLWKLRNVATCPINPNLLSDSSTAPNYLLEEPSWNKIDKMMELVKDARSKGDKVIVVSGIVFMQNYIYNYLVSNGYKVKFINAKVKTIKRTEHIKDFEDNYEILVSGNNIVNRGFDIIGANHIIFFDHEYTPEITDQMEKRLIRIGQLKKAHWHYLISNQTIDEQMKETCTMKRDAIESAIDKRNKHAGIEEMMKQADFRNPEMKIARDIHKKTILKRKVLVQKEVITPVEKETATILDFNDIVISENIVAKVEKVVAKKPKIKEQYQIEFDFGFGD